MKNLAMAFIASLWAISASVQGAGDEIEKLKGRIVGEKCAQKGKIGECYLRWAHPMVFFTDEGDYYAIELTGITQERLDEAFGQEVELHGRLTANNRVRIAQLNILKPPGTKEFFKG